jgi:hypothetical protein
MFVLVVVIHNFGLSFYSLAAEIIIRYVMLLHNLNRPLTTILMIVILVKSVPAEWLTWCSPVYWIRS